MSVVPMKKARLLLHRRDVAKALETAQSVGAMEFGSFVDAVDELPDTTASAPMVFPHEALVSRVLQTIQFLKQYEVAPSMLQTLLQGSGVTLSEADVRAKQEPEHIAEGEATVAAAEQLHIQITELEEQVRLLTERLDFFQIWSDLPVSFSEFTTAKTQTMLVQRSALSGVRRGNEESLAALLRERLTELKLTAAVHDVRAGACAVTIMNLTGEHAALDAIVKECQAEYVEVPPVTGFVREARAVTEAELETTTAKLSQLAGEVSDFAKQYAQSLRVLADVLVWQKERYAVLTQAVETEQTVVLDGWINSYAVEALETALTQADVLYALETRDPAPAEEPPVEIVNHPLLRPFEVVTRLYGLPGHRDLDPTVFLAGFFFLFFGLSLTDVGYGIFLMTAALLLLFVFHVSKSVRLFGGLLLLMGASSTLVGLLFGGYLGVDPATLPAALQALQQFDPIGDPLPVFYLALGLGVVQVMFGMVLKIVSDARNNQLVDGLLDQGPWLATFISAILYGAATLELVFASYANEFLLCIYASVIAIVVASGRKGETVLQKIQASLLSVYQSIGYFSDILSYSRLLALGLATTALAFAVNLIADIVRDAVPYIGFLLAIVVLIVGHAFTLAVNTLGAFIHSARLQFVEFFGKFITGTGRAFTPLTRHESYVTVVTEPEADSKS